jgi:hypothetical protein
LVRRAPAVLFLIVLSFVLVERASDDRDRRLVEPLAAAGHLIACRDRANACERLARRPFRSFVVACVATPVRASRRDSREDCVYTE